MIVSVVEKVPCRGLVEKVVVPSGWGIVNVGVIVQVPQTGAGGQTMSTSLKTFMGLGPNIALRVVCGIGPIIKVREGGAEASVALRSRLAGVTVTGARPVIGTARTAAPPGLPGRVKVAVCGPIIVGENVAPSAHEAPGSNCFRTAQVSLLVSMTPGETIGGPSTLG